MYTPDDTTYVAEGMQLCNTYTMYPRKTASPFPDRLDAWVDQNELYWEWERVEFVVRGRFFHQFL